MRQSGGRMAAAGLALLGGVLAPGAVQAQEVADTVEAAEAYRVDVGGYGSFRLEGSDAPEGEPAFTLRRFVVTTDAHLGGRLQVYAEVELERFGELELERGVEREAGGVKVEQELEGTGGSELALEQAWAEYRLTPGLGVRFGAVLPPVGRFNTRHDDNLWDVPRRPLIERQAQVLPGQAAWTEMGLGVVGAREAGGVRLEYEGYLLTGTTLDVALEEVAQTRVPQRSKLELEAVVRPTSGAMDGSNAADAVAGRLGVSPALGSELGVSGYYGRYTPEWLDAEESMWTLGVDGRQKLGPLEAEGELLYTRYGGVERVTEAFAAAVVEHAVETSAVEAAQLETELAVALEDLARSRYGFWVDLGWPIPLRPGALGLRDATLRPVVRYERAWLEGSVEALEFTGGRITARELADRAQERLTLGLAFRPLPQAVVQLAYDRSHALRGELIEPSLEEGAGVVNRFTLGLAVGF